VKRVILVILALLCALPAAAHEVRPAFLEITEHRDGRADVLWKQPAQGLVAVALKPSISGGLLDRRPDSVQSAINFSLARWRGLDIKGKGLGGREVRVDGLERTITDALVVIHLSNGDTLQQILTPSKPDLVIDAHAGAAVPAYLKLGIAHILTGVDHLLFVFGLMLLSANLRALVKTITAFTIAHSITLALTALKLVSVNPQLIEAMVAFSILYLAVELVHKYRGKDSITQHYPWIVAFGFGLLHGAAFAGALKEIGLPEGNIPAALFLFNVGVETGQLLFVGIVSSLFFLLRRLPLPDSSPALARLAATYAIGSFAMFWFLERLHTALESVV
jgi:hydrogenase/urease accessory protein HupE